jgi:hypothetical protein
MSAPAVASPVCAESVHVAGECFCHLDTLGPDERKGDISIVRTVGAGHLCGAETPVKLNGSA